VAQQPKVMADPFFILEPRVVRANGDFHDLDQQNYIQKGIRNSVSVL